MKKLKAGIVGCGGIANGKHMPAMKKSGLYELVAFCDIVIERAEAGRRLCDDTEPLSCENIDCGDGEREGRYV